MHSLFVAMRVQCTQLANMQLTFNVHACKCLHQLTLDQENQQQSSGWQHNVLLGVGGSPETAVDWNIAEHHTIQLSTEIMLAHGEAQCPIHRHHRHVTNSNTSSKPF